MKTLLLSLFLCGCASKPELRLDVMRVGQLRSALPAGCKVDFADAPAFAAMLMLTQVGMITAQVPRGQVDDHLRHEVAARACELGGDVITFNVGMSNGDTEIVQFLVFKKPDEPPPAKPQSTGTGI